MNVISGGIIFQNLLQYCAEQNCCCTSTEVFGQVQQGPSAYLRPPPVPYPPYFSLPNISPCTSARTLRTVNAIAVLARRQETRHAMIMRMRRVSPCRLLTRAALRTSAAGTAETSILPAPKPRAQDALGSDVPTAEIQQWYRRWCHM